MNILSQVKRENVFGKEGKLQFSPKSWAVRTADPKKIALMAFCDEAAARFDVQQLKKRTADCSDISYISQVEAALLCNAFGDAVEYINTFIADENQKFEFSIFGHSHDVYGHYSMICWVLTKVEKNPVYWIEFRAKGSQVVEHGSKVTNFFRRLLRKPIIPSYCFEVSRVVKVTDGTNWMSADLAVTKYLCRSTSCIEQAVRITGKDYNVPVDFAQKYQEYNDEQRTAFFKHETPVPLHC